LWPIALIFPILYSPPICFRFKDRDKPPLDLIFGAELKAGHTTNNLSIELISAQRLAAQEMGIGWAVEPACHPGMI
jgi:hypothetical protein